MTVWVNTPFDTLPGEGGRPMRYWLLARALVAAGHNVVVWSSDFHHLTKDRRALPAVYEAEGFQVRLIPTLAYGTNVCWRRWKSHGQYARTWERIAHAAVASQALVPPDCMLVSMPPLGLYAAAARMRCVWGNRVVVDIQDAWPETFYRLFPRGLRGLARGLFWGARRMARKAYCGADGVSAVAERYVELARDAGCRSETGVFPLGCTLPKGEKPAARGAGTNDVGNLNAERRTPNTEHRTPDVEVADKKKNAEDIEKRPAVALHLCYVGNLGKAYDIRTVIEGVRALTEEGEAVTLKVAGDGPQRALVLEAIESGLPINYCGYLKQEELQACLDGCDVGVVPMFASSWVAVPNKVADYAAAGLAMVNGLKGETQAFLERYEAGMLYEAGDVRSFVSAVRRYSKDRLLLAQHRQGARRLAEEEFDAAGIYPAMAKWIEGVTGKRGP